jgi:hypothetical protein
MPPATGETQIGMISRSVFGKRSHLRYLIEAGRAWQGQREILWQAAEPLIDRNSARHLMRAQLSQGLRISTPAARTDRYAP